MDVATVVWVPIIVAIISGPLVAVIQKLRSDNNKDHAEVKTFLQNILTRITRVDERVEALDEKIEKVDQRLEKHIDYHLEKDKK